MRESKQFLRGRRGRHRSRARTGGAARAAAVRQRRSRHSRRGVSRHARCRAAIEGADRPERENADRLVQPAVRNRDAGRREGAQRSQDRRHDAGAGEGGARTARHRIEQGRLPEGDADRRRRRGARAALGADAQATQAIRFGRKEFYLAILGKPSASDTWMLQFGGHHLAINVTLAGRASVLTPTHTGAQPASFTIEGRDHQAARRRERQGVCADEQPERRPAEAGLARRRRSGTWCSAPAKTAR